MKKILTFGIMLIFLLTTVSSSAEASSLNEDIDINIYAGNFGYNIGVGIGYNISNNLNQNVTVYFSIRLDYFHQDRSLGLNHTIEPNSYSNGNFGFFIGIKKIHIKARANDIIVTREGISIGPLVILYK